MRQIGLSYNLLLFLGMAIGLVPHLVLADQQIARYQGLVARGNDGAACAQTQSVTINSADPSAYSGDRLALQHLIGAIRANYADCLRLRSLNLDGYANGQLAFQATVSAQDGWRLPAGSTLQQAPAALRDPRPNPNPSFNGNSVVEPLMAGVQAYGLGTPFAVNKRPYGVGSPSDNFPTQRDVEAMCQRSEFSPEEYNTLARLLTTLGIADKSFRDSCDFATIKAIYYYNRKYHFQADSTPTRSLLEDVRRHAIGSGPTVSNSAGMQVPAGMVMSGGTPDVSPPAQADNVVDWRRKALTPVQYTTDGNVLDAHEVKRLVERHTLYWRQVHNNVIDRIYTVAGYYDGSGTRWTIDNQVGTNTLIYKIQGNAICIDGFVLECSHIRALPGGAYVTVAQNGKDMNFITAVEDGDTLGIIAKVEDHERRFGPQEREMTKQINTGLKALGEEIKDDLQRAGKCSSQGGEYRYGKCWVHQN